MLPALIAACAPGPGSADRYVEALELARSDPAAALVACGEVGDPELRGDCGLACVEALAGPDGEPTGALLDRCASLGGWAADECAFQVAERRADPRACDRAGAFADDCRLHLLSAGFAAWVPAGARPSDPDLLARLAREAAAAGLAAGDPRPASAFFRWVLGQAPTLDRAACREVADPASREACLATGLALYGDRLNHARDTGAYPCDGTPLPPALSHTPDPDLDALRARREAEGLCR